MGLSRVIQKILKGGGVYIGELERRGQEVEVLMIVHSMYLLYFKLHDTL